MTALLEQVSPFVRRPRATELGPSGVTYREESAYEREIRRRIRILSAFYRVDIWSEDLDRLVQGPR